MAKVTKATRLQVVAINDLLRQHLKPVEGEEGLCVYDGDWSDAKIAETVGDGCNSGHVKNFRVEVFGILRRHSADKPGSDDARIAEMQAAILAQAATITKLTDLHAKLCLALSVNRVLDVRHLTGSPAFGFASANGQAAPANGHAVQA